MESKLTKPVSTSFGPSICLSPCDEEKGASVSSFSGFVWYDAGRRCFLRRQETESMVRASLESWWIRRCRCFASFERGTRRCLPSEGRDRWVFVPECHSYATSTIPSKQIDRKRNWTSSIDRFPFQHDTPPGATRSDSPRQDGHFSETRDEACRTREGPSKVSIFSPSNGRISLGTKHASCRFASSVPSSIRQPRPSVRMLSDGKILRRWKVDRDRFLLRTERFLPIDRRSCSFKTSFRSFVRIGSGNEIPLER